MSTITLHSHPESLSSPQMWLLRAEESLSAPVLLEHVGDLAMQEGAGMRWLEGARPAINTDLRLVASATRSPAAPEDVQGMATVSLPMADNRDHAWIAIVVRQEYRRHGLGSRLFDEAERLATEHDRSVLLAWMWEPADVPEDQESLVPETGSGRIPANTPHAHFLLARGFRLGQVERISRLQLPAADARRRVADDARAAVPQEYEAVVVVGPTPEEFLDEAAFLREEMSSDVPTGDAEFERETWDAERIRDHDRGLELVGRQQIQTFVRHRPSGRLVGFTRIFRDADRPTHGHQWETLVVRDHRGHRLGMLVKAVNHAAMASHWPATTALITGNAAENRYMLAINEALGYRPYAAASYWRRMASWR